MRNILRKALTIVLILLPGILINGQGREFTFNSPGSPCYFNYLCFTADSNYSFTRRPFIFILSDENISVKETMRRDSLKDVERFKNYYFVYIPNKGGSSLEKLACTESLAGLITGNFRYGKTNIFFQVNDTLITRNDIVQYGLSGIFKSVRLNAELKNIFVEKNDSLNSLAEFTETLAAYKPDEKVQADQAKYYVDNTSNDNEADTSQAAAVKTFFGPPSAFKFSLTGTVHDRSTGEALPFAAVSVRGTTIGTTTNNDGYFTLLNVPSDTCTLNVQYVGYGTTQVFLTPDTPKKNFRIDILPFSQSLKEVKVYGHRDDVVFVRKSEVSSIRFTPVKMEQLPSIGEKDVMRSFQLMPGVGASNESSSGLYVRGGTPDQNLVLYDGFTVYHVDHLYGFFSAFNANAVKDIQLYKGGFESRFGGRISSVTEITSKEGNQKMANVGADISLLSTNIFAEVPAGKNFTSFVAFRKSYQGAIYDMIFKKFNGSKTFDAPDVGTGRERMFSQSNEVTSYFYDLNAKFTWRPGEKDIIALSLFNGTDKLDNSFGSNIPSFGQRNANFSMNSTDLTKYGNIGSSLKWSRKWNSRLYGNTILSYSNYFNDRDRSSERTLINPDNESSVSKNGVFENNDLKDYSLKSDYQYDVSDYSQFRFGLFTTLYDVKYSYSETDTTELLNRSGKAWFSGIYIQNKTRLLGNRLQIVPGIRADWFQNTGKVYYEPRLSTSFSLTDHVNITGATGLYYQFANRVMREDIMSGSKEFWILADGDKIPVSSAFHLTGGISYETSDYTFSAEAYYKKISNLTEYSLRINANPMEIDYNENFFNGKGYSRGIEFLAQKNTGRFTGWASYTLGEAMNHFDAYTDTYYPANQDVRHEFKIVGLYNYRRWNFTADWIYATGRPYTAPSGAYTITLLDGTTRDFFTVTAKNGVRLPDYHRLDVSASYKLLMGNRGDKRRRELGTVSFSIFNIYNHKNIWYKQFTIAEGNVVETNINYLGITPNITLSFRLR